MKSSVLEEKIASWIATLIGGSYILFILILLSVFAISKVLSGEILNDPFLLKAILIAPLYVLSIVLVATLPGKPIKRRTASWIFSSAFHLGLILYLAIFHDWGTLIFVVGIVELIITVLSLIALSDVLKRHKKKQGLE